MKFATWVVRVKNSTAPGIYNCDAYIMAARIVWALEDSIIVINVFIVLNSKCEFTFS